MNRTWTFARTLVVGFALVVALALVMAVISLVGLHHVVQRKDEVIDTDSRLVLSVQQLLSIRDARAAANRGYLISGQQKYLDEQYRNDVLFDQQLDTIRKLSDTDRGHQLVGQIAVREARFVELDRAPVQLRKAGASPQAVTVAWEKIDTERLDTTSVMNTLFAYSKELVDARKWRASQAASFDTKLILVLLSIIVLAAAVLAGVLTRRLRTRIGSTVGEVQNSSAELQATADQQALGAREQATTMTEISTTTTELLASARQIAASAQLVANAAEATGEAGHAGSRTVRTAQESMAEIREQVDTVVNLMLELGERSQRIGLVLDIVTELAEQTNILAINSTIEAVGAGESGLRFAVVADEIRKLADRVSDSTKEIRTLIDVTRSAVNTTVMATEIGSKAVDAGSAQVEQVAASFEQILALVGTTIEAARAIESSTRQQTVAVEQVDVAIADVAATIRETQTSTGQTLQTASHLRQLSTKLGELVVAQDN